MDFDELEKAYQSAWQGSDHPDYMCMDLLGIGFVEMTPGSIRVNGVEATEDQRIAVESWLAQRLK